MKNKLFIFGIMFAAVMLTGCPTITDDTQQQLDITKAEHINVNDVILSTWQIAEQESLTKGYGAYWNSIIDVQQLPIYYKSKRAGVGTHCVEFHIEGEAYTYFMQVTINEDDTVTFGAWVKTV